MSAKLLLDAPFTSRNAAGELRQRVLSFIVSNRPAPGTRLATEAELSELSSLSRSTVRRALDPLEKDGWIARRAGAGTFIGPRAGQGGGARDPLRSLSIDVRPSIDAATGQRVIRVAVLIFNIGDLAHDWYTPAILEGIDRSADQSLLTVELIGDRDSDVDALSRRLARSRPDVLICCSNAARHAFVLRDAQKMGIQCLVSGTPHLGLGLPSVSEDNRQAMKLAVEHLVQKGHRKIGLVLERVLERWSADRHEAFLEALDTAGIDPDEGMVHWTKRDEPRQGSEESLFAVETYLKKRKPTAVVAGSYMPMMYLDRLARDGTIRVPQDLSVVSFEQTLASGQWLGGHSPTYVKMPLEEMGRRLALLSRSAVQQEELPLETYLPSTIVEGDTVAQVGERIGGGPS